MPGKEWDEIIFHGDNWHYKNGTTLYLLEKIQDYIYGIWE